MSSTIGSTVIRLLAIAGGRITGLLFLGIVLGVCLGALEVVFAYGLVHFLQHFNLVPHSQSPGLFTGTTLSPVVILLLVAIAKTGIDFCAKVTISLGYELFIFRIRERVGNALGARINDPGLRMSVAEVSQVFANLSPKSASFVFAGLQLVNSAIVASVLLANLFRLSAALTALALVAIVVIGLPLLFTRSLVQKFSGRVYADVTEFTSRLLRDYRNLEFIRIIGVGDSEAKELSRKSSRIMRDAARYAATTTINTLWPQLGGVAVVIVMVLANNEWNWVSAEVLVSFLYLLIAMANNLGVVMTSTAAVQFNRPFADRLADYFERPTTTPSASGHKSLDAIRTLDVHGLAIGRDATLLENLSFTAAAGELISIAGPSGRGKTTLLMTLVGVVPSRGGSILWNQMPLETLDTSAFQRHIAYSGADPFLLDVSIRENLLLGAPGGSVTESDFQHALSLAACGFVQELPHGLDHVLREGGEGISAGQKQRLSIARALLRRPQVLLLDEATANIDVEVETIIFSNIRKAFPDTLIIAVSHRESIARFATRTLTL